jgi:predicted acetyltransferase
LVDAPVKLDDVLTLRFLEPKDEPLFLDALAEDWGTFVFAHYYEPGMAFGKYLKRLESKRDGSGIAAHEVAATLLYAFAPGADGAERCVGRSSIRHTLNEKLFAVGGHIGYGVRPDERRKGYATQILGLSLPILKMIGVDRALVTCDDTNLGSVRTIERNGGYLENKITDPETGVLKRRYWIPL